MKPPSQPRLDDAAELAPNPSAPTIAALAPRLEKQARILLDALEFGTFFPELGEAAAMAFRASVVNAAAQAVLAIDAVRSSAGPTKASRWPICSHCGEEIYGDVIYLHSGPCREGARAERERAIGPTSPHQQAAAALKPCPVCRGRGHLYSSRKRGGDESCAFCGGTGRDPMREGGGS